MDCNERGRIRKADRMFSKRGIVEVDGPSPRDKRFFARCRKRELEAMISQSKNKRKRSRLEKAADVLKALETNSIIQTYDGEGHVVQARNAAKTKESIRDSIMKNLHSKNDGNNDVLIPNATTFIDLDQTSDDECTKGVQISFGGEETIVGCSSSQHSSESIGGWDFIDYDQPFAFQGMQRSYEEDQSEYSVSSASVA